MARQYVMGLPPLARLSRADFLPAPANEAALAFIEAWPRWPAPVLVLHGPAGAGKSHLAAIWQARAGAFAFDPRQLRTVAPRALIGDAPALLIEDIDQALAEAAGLEEPLFSLWTAVVERQGHLLLTARAPAARWAVRLPDLASRLRGAPSVAVAAPDDALLEALFVKLMADRQLRVQPGVVRFLLPRIERSFAAVEEIVAAIDTLALEEQREITIPLVRRVLEALEESSREH